MRSKADIGPDQHGGLYRTGQGLLVAAEIAPVEPAFKEVK
jgi:hypothetical protein